MTQQVISNFRTPSAEDAAAVSNERDIRDLRSDFDALMARYEKPLYNLVFHWMGDADEALDLAQDTFISAYRSRGEFRGDAKVRTWLFRIALNRCKNRCKQQHRQREFEGTSLDDNVPSGQYLTSGDARDVADWSMSPEPLLEQKELWSRIHRAVDALPMDFRTVLVLREAYDLDYADIAAITEAPLATVKNRLSRARGMIRRRMEPYYCL